MSWLLIIKDHDTGEVESQIEYETREACEGAFNGFVTLFNMDTRKRVVSMHENTQLAFQLDPDTEAEIKAIEARSKYEAEQQRIEDLCEKFEGHGLCSNLTPVGDEYDRNWGQCHVCDEWGIVHCDFGTAGSRALCEKHLRMAADDRLQPFINIYGVTRAYGGPEEGGWWYDCGEPLASIPICVGMSDSDLERLRLEIRQNQDQILRLIPWADRYERISVNLDMRPGRYWPLEKPHYE